MNSVRTSNRSRFVSLPLRAMMIVLVAMAGLIFTPAIASATVGTTTVTGGTAWYVTPASAQTGWDASACTTGDSFTGCLSSTSTGISLKITHTTTPSGFISWYWSCQPSTDFLTSGSLDGTTSTTQAARFTWPSCAGSATSLTLNLTGGNSCCDHVNTSTNVTYLSITVQTTAPVNACTGSGFTATGSWSSNTLAVRIVMATGSTFPAAGFYVGAPDPGIASPPTTPTLIVRSTDSVDGAILTYYNSVSLTSLSTMTARIWSMTTTSSAACYKSITLSGSAIVAGDTSGIDNTAPSSPSNCSWSINPLVYFKCLFFPDSSQMQGWNSSVTAIQTSAPVSAATSGISFMQSIYGDVPTSTTGTCTHTATGVSQNQSANSSLNGQVTCDGFGNINGHVVYNQSTGASYDVSLPILTRAGDYMEGQGSGQTYGPFLYNIMRVIIIILFAMGAYNRITRSVGNQS